MDQREQENIRAQLAALTASDLMRLFTLLHIEVGGVDLSHTNAEVLIGVILADAEYDDVIVQLQKLGA